MMNSSFFRSQQPSRSAQRSSPKVISVPVHFISSEKPSTTLKASAVIKIQRIFRGFLVRKSVKKIASIRNEVSEIEQRINDTEVSDLIRRDAKERLKVNETLMSLLFKLDSIRGFDCGVRDLRKAVTKKAIALQEKVDSIAYQALDSPKNEIDVCTSASDFVVDEKNDANVEEDLKEEESSLEMQIEDESRQVLVKLMGDNEKMMKLMMQISERNEMQTRMINSLSRRVEQLEKAFMNHENLRKKKLSRVNLRRRDASICNSLLSQ